jgi:anti-sigma factor RsiW
MAEGACVTVDPACREQRALMTAYLDDVLPSATTIHLEAHLVLCADCRAHLEQLRQSIAVTGSVSADDIDDVTMRRLRDAFRDW